MKDRFDWGITDWLVPTIFMLLLIFTISGVFLVMVDSTLSLLDSGNRAYLSGISTIEMVEEFKNPVPLKEAELWYKHTVVSEGGTTGFAVGSLVFVIALLVVVIVGIVSYILRLRNNIKMLNHELHLKNLNYIVPETVSRHGEFIVFNN